MARVYTRREINRRKTGYQIFAGISDFIGALIGLAVIVACVLFLVSLIHWIIRDGQSAFASLWKIFQDALIIPQ